MIYNIIRSKSREVRNYILTTLGEMTEKVDLVYKIEKRPPYFGNITAWGLNSDNILETVKAFNKKLNNYIVNNKLDKAIANAKVEATADLNLSIGDVINLFGRINFLLNKVYSGVPEVLNVNLDNYIKLAQRESGHLKGLKDLIEQMGNDINYRFLEYITTKVLNADTADEIGISYLASQLGLSLPVGENGSSILTLQEQRVTVQLAEFYNSWGGTIHELNQALEFIFSPYGSAYVTFDEKERTNIINIVFEKRPREFVLNLWKDMGLLPPERLGYNAKLNIHNDIPIGFNPSYVNFQANKAKFAYDEKDQTRSTSNSFNYLIMPFADQGDKEEIPDSGSPVSFEQGFGESFSVAIAEGGSVLDRKHFNWLFNKLYQDYYFWQTNTMFEWSEKANYFKADRKKDILVKYQNKVYKTKGIVSNPDGLTPDKSKDWELIVYEKFLTQKKLNKIMGLLFPVGMTVDGLYGVKDHIKKEYWQPIDEKYPDLKSNKEWFSRVGYHLETPKVIDYTIKKHDHGLKLEEVDWEHRHPINEEMGVKKVPGNSGAWFLWANSQYLARDRESSKGGSHTHRITHTGSEKKDGSLTPQYINLDKFILYNNQLDLSSGKKNQKDQSSTEYLIFSSILNSLTYPIPLDSNEKVNFKNGFWSMFENPSFTDAASAGLDIRAFNQLIKEYSIFVKQVIQRGWVPYNGSISYNYGCRVKFQGEIYISLIDKNIHAPTDEKTWLREKDILSREEVESKINDFISSFVGTGFYSFSDEDVKKNQDGTGRAKINVNSDNPIYFDGTWVLRNIVGTTYGDELDNKIALPAIGGYFIRYDNLNKETAKNKFPSNIGYHKHQPKVSDEGGHTHTLYATGDSTWVGNSGGGKEGSYRDVIWLQNSNDSQFGQLHTHPIKYVKAGSGTEVIPKNISTNYYIRY